MCESARDSFARLEWHRFAAAISTKARTSRGSRRRPLSATRRGTVGLKRPSRHCRAHGHTRWQAVHNRRCASCGVSRAARIRRVLDAIPRLRRLRRRARLPFPYRPGAVEGWGHHRDRAGGDGSHRGTARAAVSGHQQGTRRDCHAFAEIIVGDIRPILLLLLGGAGLLLVIACISARSRR